VGAHVIAVAMVTVDRGLRGLPNYLYGTMRRLQGAGVFKSRLLTSFDLCDSGGSRAWPDLVQLEACGFAQGRRPSMRLHIPGRPLLASLNVAAALALAGSRGADWVLFMEDDIDVCADLLESCESWLLEHERPRVPVYSFGANYEQVAAAYAAGLTSWDYPIDAFYGTQCFALRSADAISLAAWLRAHPEYNGSSGAYDLTMHDWAKANAAVTFVASAPSFVQHAGRESYIRPGGEPFGFATWPGNDWSYRQATDQREATG